VRDDLRRYVVDHLGDSRAVLVVDETGDLKKGVHTVGVQRQYTGTAGRIENSQVAVYLAYAAPVGHTLIDRALYLPAAWTDDPDRCAAAGIPDDVTFATKPALATTMITAALDAGVPAGWVAGDEVYGADPTLRTTLEDRGIGYVLAVAANRRIPVGQGFRWVDQLTAGLPARSWQRLSAGAGAHGPRLYSWAWIPIPAATGHRWVLVRRNDTTREHAYYLTYHPQSVPLRELVAVAGQRWRVEESFQTGKGLTGLDQHQVRRWTSWHRWVTLAMFAHAFLTVITAGQRGASPTPDGLIPITVNEQRRLFDALLLRPRTTPTRLLVWSTWRRRHQHRARTSHYRRREQAP
jgi:SRSO17 transposase